MSGKTKKIAILGATGTTGRQIASRLSEDGADILLCGRDRTRLEDLAASLPRSADTFPVDAREPEDLDELAGDVAVLVNCAGPFSLLGRPVVEAAVKNRIHYLDITGEQAFIRQVVETRVEPESGTILVPACAFEYALADAASMLVEKQLGGLDIIEVVYKFDSIHTSIGTRKSVICALGAPALQLVEKRLTPITGGRVEPWENLSRFPFPGGEVFLIPLHSEVRTIGTYLTGKQPSWCIALVSRLAPAVASMLRESLFKLIESKSQNPSRTSQEQTGFAIDITGHRQERTARMRIEGINPYGLTAAIAARTAMMLAGEASTGSGGATGDRAGALSPAMIGGPEAIKAVTEQMGTTWTMIQDKNNG
ncbi:MAG: SDR family NAD(P)-dependent oxidoreductase [Cyanobacteria bacterium HKST-UBA02]|nr:SDR family NAD(P)-dependent oxidoreductase [Cyanobacteria bacterium HKST-UBA02]